MRVGLPHQLVCETFAQNEVVERPERFPRSVARDLDQARLAAVSELDGQALRLALGPHSTGKPLQLGIVGPVEDPQALGVGAEVGEAGEPRGRLTGDRQEPDGQHRRLAAPQAPDRRQYQQPAHRRAAGERQVGHRGEELEALRAGELEGPQQRLGRQGSAGAEPQPAEELGAVGIAHGPDLERPLAAAHQPVGARPGLEPHHGVGDRRQGAVGAVVEKPIHMLFVTKGGDTPVWCAPRTLISADSTAEATIVEHYVSTGGETLTLPVTERINAEGEIEMPLLEEEVRQAVHQLQQWGVEVIAVGLIWVTVITLFVI